MTEVRPTVPGIERDFSSTPTDDTEKNLALEAGNPFSLGRHWTPFGLTAFGHQLNVNIATGNLSVSVHDLNVPYHSMRLKVHRRLDVQEQHMQHTYLTSHPNTDPKFHFFGNWQFQQEASIDQVWLDTYPELLVTDGDGEATLFYREFPTFEMNSVSSALIEYRLRSYGVPGHMLSTLGWQYESGDFLLRTRQRMFSVITGRHLSETLVDLPQVRLWRLIPTTGAGLQYSSEYYYREYVDTDGLREVSFPSLIILQVDSVGHTIAFRPAVSEPPYRSYLLEDGANRSIHLELDHFVTYLDGNKPGGHVKVYMVSQIIDRTRSGNNIIHYLYEEGRLVEVQYPGQNSRASRSVRYRYNGNGDLIVLSDPYGNSYNIEYTEDLLDADDRLLPRLKVAGITDPEGNSVRYNYDHPDQVVTVTFRSADGEQRSVDFHYRSDVGDTRQRYLIEETIQVTSGYSGNQAVRNQWQYTDDGHYQIKARVNPLGSTTSYEYNDFNQVTAVIDASGHRREFKYDLQPSPTSLQPHRYDLSQISETNIHLDGTTYPVESAVSYRRYDTVSSNDPADTVQSTHRVESQTDERNNIWRFDYDDLGSFKPLKPTRVTDPTGALTSWKFDAAGNRLQETDAEGHTSTWSYNTQGQITSSIDANGFQRYWVYDQGTGWLTDTTDALGSGPGDPAHSVHYVWNENGQRIRETDPVGDSTEYTYYNNQRLKSVTRYGPRPEVVSYQYDAIGRLWDVTDPKGQTTFFRYDEASRLYETYRNDPVNPTIRLVFDSAGQVITMIDRNGQSTHYSYDLLGRVIQIQEPSWPRNTGANPGKVLAFQYDRLGRRLLMGDSQLTGNYTYRYDEKGNVRDRTDPFGYTLHYDFDARNDLIRIYDTANIVDLHFTRDALGRVTVVRDSNYLDPLQTFRLFYTDGVHVNNLYRIALGSSGINTHFEYDPNGYLTLCRHKRTNKTLASYGYRYRADGLIGRTTGSHAGRYDYDGLKQLTEERDSNVHDGYDGAGNRLWRAAVPASDPNQNIYDTDNRLLSTPMDGTTFTYDNNGNLLTQQHPGSNEIRYIFDGANRLTRVEDGTRFINYLYDGDGLLLERSVTDQGSTQSRRYRYAGRSILMELDGAENILVLYTRDDHGRLLRRRGSVLTPASSTDRHSLFYLHDGMQSVCRLIDSAGIEHFQADYDAWGQAALSNSSDSRSSFLYRQGYHDLDTGLLSYGARWYDPKLGRWLSQDPLLAQLLNANADLLPRFNEFLNLYTYVRNNPLLFYDPEGLNAQLPKGWPEPPGWKGGRGWKDVGNGELEDPNGDRFHWHPEDEQHHDHWDYRQRDRKGRWKDKERLDKEGNDLGEEGLKKVVVVGVGIGISYEIAKWGAAIFFAPETGFTSLFAAGLTP